MGRRRLDPLLRLPLLLFLGVMLGWPGYCPAASPLSLPGPLPQDTPGGYSTDSTFQPSRPPVGPGDAPAPTRAESAPVDVDTVDVRRGTAPADADTVDVRRGTAPVDADTVAAQNAPSPRGALLRSILLPGWGQWYNDKPYKAAFFSATTAGLLSWAVAAHRDVSRTGDELQRLRQEAPFDPRITALQQLQQDQAARRNTRALYVVLAVTAAALDAYVDAHLAEFDAHGPTLALIMEPRNPVISMRIRW